jgi:hypothetical protein
LEQCIGDLVAGFPYVAPDEFGLQCFEEGFDHSIIPAVSLSAHRHFEAQLAHSLLIIVRAILATTVCVMNAAWWWITQGNSPVEGLQCQILLEPLLTAHPTTRRNSSVWRCAIFILLDGHNPIQGHGTNPGQVQIGKSLNTR